MNTENTTAAAPVKENPEEPVAKKPAPSAFDPQLIDQLVGQARDQGLPIDGENGLLAELTKRLVGSALDGEITSHLGYEKHERGEAQNSRNGTRTKTVQTKGGPIQIEVPRDREGSFEPAIVKKRQRRLGSIEDVVLSLSARGMTHGDIAAHLAEIYGTEVSKTTISTITDKVLVGMAEWQNRPLDPVYPVVFIDAIHVKIRDGQVANRPIYVVLAVTAEGHRDILGLWAGDGGEGAKYWLQVLTEIKNRGTQDVLMLVCDGLNGLPDSVAAVWPDTVVQTCVVHLMRQLVQVRVQGRLAGSGHRAEADLPRGDPVRSRSAFRGLQEGLGRKVSGDFQAVGTQLGRVRPVLAVRPGDPPDRVHHERHRIGERQDPQSGEIPRPFPHRAGSAEVRVYGGDCVGSDRAGSGSVEAGVECF